MNRFWKYNLRIDTVPDFNCHLIVGWELWELAPRYYSSITFNKRRLDSQFYIHTLGVL